ncbi:MAG: cysteine--tRNA ligase [Acidobacteriota bacterium]
MIKIYNTRKRAKETFVPVDAESGKVGLYYCGVTVYDSLHLGHARAAIVPDLVRRYLEHRGYVVRYVSNFTDIDDKIILRALRENRDWREITSIYMEEFHRMTALLGNRPADVYPRATDHVPEMLDLISRLMDGENAYVASDGDIYFDTSSFNAYGVLSGRKLDEQRAGGSGRLTEDQLAVKRNAADFILWKLAVNDSEEMRAHGDRVPAWDSPWGRGRPGWHLECSALSRQYLGMPFDIHGGGRDLVFPHHENEKAQNECGYCSELDGGESVRYWIHNGFITVKAETEAELADEHTVEGASKMSKSLGNVKWLKDMIWPEGPYDPMAVRMLMLTSHYRSPLTFSPDLLDQSTARVERIYAAAERLTDDLPDSAEGEGGATEAIEERMAAITASFEDAMDDDFNTPRALASIDELISVAKSLGDAPAGDRRLAAKTLLRLCHILGVRAERPLAAGSGGGDAETEDGLLKLISELRGEARAEKNWGLADRIRDRLGDLGFEVRDGAGGGEIVRKG